MQMCCLISDTPTFKGAENMEDKPKNKREVKISYKLDTDARVRVSPDNYSYRTKEKHIGFGKVVKGKNVQGSDRWLEVILHNNSIAYVHMSYVEVVKEIVGQ